MAIHSSANSGVNKRQLVFNAASNYVRLAVVMLTGIAIQSYVIRKLGREQYSILPIVQTALLLFAIFPTALGNGAARAMAAALGSGDQKLVRQITTSAFLPLCALAVVCLAAMGILSLFFDSIFSVPQGMEGVGGKVLIVLSLGGAAAIPASIFRSGLIASQRFAAANLTEMLASIAKLPLVVLGFLIFKIGLMGFAIINSFVTAFSGLGQWLVAKYLMPWQRVDLKSFDLQVSKEVSHFSGYLLMMSAIGILYSRGSYVLINKLMDPTLLTGYSVVCDILAQCSSLISTGTTVLLPSVAMLYAAGDHPRIYRLAVRSNRLLVGLAFPALAFASVYGDQLLTIYIGKQYADFWLAMALMSTSVAIATTQESSGIIAIATGRVKAQTIVGALVVVVILLVQLTFVLLGFGLMGVVVPSVLITLIHRVVSWPWYMGRLLGCGFQQYFSETVAIPLAACLPVAVLFLIFRWVGFGQTILHLSGIFAIGLCVHCVTYSLVALDKVERLKLRNHAWMIALQCVPFLKTTRWLNLH